MARTKADAHCVVARCFSGEEVNGEPEEYGVVVVASCDQNGNVALVVITGYHVAVCESMKWFAGCYWSVVYRDGDSAAECCVVRLAEPESIEEVVNEIRQGLDDGAEVSVI